MDTPPTIEQELGGAPPAGIARLDPTVQQRLAELIAAARVHQADELDRAIDAGLEHVPTLARRAIRKVLF